MIVSEVILILEFLIVYVHCVYLGLGGSLLEPQRVVALMHLKLSCETLFLFVQYRAVRVG